MSNLIQDRSRWADPIRPVKSALERAAGPTKDGQRYRLQYVSGATARGLDAPPGLALRIMAGKDGKPGARSWVLIYRIDGKDRWHTFGRYPKVPPDKAVKDAWDLHKAIRRGDTPAPARKVVKAVPAESAAEARTIGDLIARYKRDYLPRNAASTHGDAERQCDRIAESLKPETPVADVTRDDVNRFHVAMKAKPTEANRTLARAKVLFNIAMDLGWRPDNPCRKIKFHTERGYSRYMTESESSAVAAELATWTDQVAVNAVRLVMLTGCRPAELCRTKWSEVDLEGAEWTKPPMGTKQKKIHIVPLSDAAVAAFRELHKITGNREHVLHSDVTASGHRRSLRGPWDRIKKVVKFGGRTPLYSNRHTFGSRTLAAGGNLPQVKEMLGHASIATTMRYAHVGRDDLRKLSDSVSGGILPAPAEPAKTTP